jgi:hypothetical protein
MDNIKKWADDAKNCGHNGRENFLWIYVLGGCGCGSADDLAELAWKTLDHFATDIGKREYNLIYDNNAMEVIAHWMDSLGLIEHGTSIAGSWLTEEGKALYDIVKDLEPTISEHNRI